MSITTRYFVADAKHPALAPIVQSALAEHKARGQRQKALSNDLGTELYMLRNGHLTGFCYPNPEAVPAGLRMKESVTHEGKSYLLMVPDRRTKAGREIMGKMKQANGDQANFSESVCRGLDIYDLRIGKDPASRTGMAMFETVCGMAGDHILFKIPFGGSQGGMVETKDPVLPDYLQEVTVGEFTAIAEERSHG